MPDSQKRPNHFSSAANSPQLSPIARALSLFVGSLLFAVSIIAGGFILLLFLAVALVIAAIVGTRLWWWRRQMRKAHAENAAGDAQKRGDARHGTTVIEGEYNVIDE